MDCFNNLIGITGKCASDSPESVYNLNDLPGVSLFNVESGISSEANTAVSYLERIKNVLAPQMVVDEVRNRLSPNYEMKSVVEQDILGVWKDNLQTQAAQAYKVGVNISITKKPYLALDITRIGLMVQSSGAVNVEVIDLISGQTLDTISVTAVAGVPTYIDLSKTYYTRKQNLNLFIGYDATALGGYKTDLAKGFCSGCSSTYKKGSFMAVKGSKIATGDQAIDENLVSMAGTGGVNLTYSVRCAVEPFICSIRQVLATAILYKCGELIMQEMRSPNNRLNSTVAVHGEDFERLQIDYEEKYSETMKGVLQNLQLPKDQCFKCKQRVKHEVVTP